MDALARLIWNPFLSFFYVELGVLFLILTGASACTKGFRNFLNTWGRGTHDTPDTVSHRKAFFASLAATIGVGDLAGTGTAIHLGGPGALFWMWVSAVCGMSFRMISTYMTVKHQPDDPRHPTFGTPMVYLGKLLESRWQWLSGGMAVLLLVKGNVVANIIQSNSIGDGMEKGLGVAHIFTALFVAASVGFVILGGMKRIVDVSAAIAPFMLAAYLLAGGFILLSDPHKTMNVTWSVFRYAFTPYAFGGGVTGYAVLQAVQFGVSRGVFSHASGIGVAPFFQGANKDHPAVGAFMAGFTPFVDTLIVCTVTGLVILSDSHWPTITGADLTMHSFYDALGLWGEILVMSCLVIFGFTTITGWAYCSEKCFLYLTNHRFEGKGIKAYRWLFVAVTFMGPFLPVPFVWSLADVMVGIMFVAHILPLTYILIRHLRPTRIDLGLAIK